MITLRSSQSIIIRLSVLVIIVLSSCIPVIRQQKQTAACPVMNEKIFLYPVQDSTSLELFEGWPSEKPIQDILLRHFRQVDAALLFTMRQHEKYGLYELVEDSLLASVRVCFVVGKFTSTKDALTFPVRMTVKRYTDNTSRSFSFEAVGMYRAKSRPKSQIHYINLLLSDFRRHFPYDKISGVFCRPNGKENTK
jgi:hypothetical protein